MVEAGGFGVGLVFPLPVSGQRQHEGIARTLGLAQAPGNLVTVEHRQADVKHHNLRAECDGCLECFDPVRGGTRHMAFKLQESGDALRRVAVVVDDQNPANRGDPGRLRQGRRDMAGHQAQARQPQRELRTALGAFTGCVDAAAMQLGKAARKRQANAQAALGAVEAAMALREKLEDARQKLGVYADARAMRGSGGARRRITSSAVCMGASGLRSSCESIARNSSLRRLDSRSDASAARRSAISD